MKSEEKMPEEPDDSEFLDIAKDPAGARALRKAFEQIAQEGSGVHSGLKEMALSVLAGREGLRQVMTSSAYAEAAAQQIQPIRERWEGLSETERETLAAEGEKRLHEYQLLLDQERLERQQSPKNAQARHSTGSWSAY